jgi:hypothetical protein
MIRLLSILALVAAAPAWAVGEHISVTGPAREQLSETLCISMECNGGADYTIASKQVGGKMELKVVGPSGIRLSLTMAINVDGRLANSDAMTATSQLIQAIEAPVVAKETAAVEKAEKASAAKAKAKVKTAKAVKKPAARPVRVAARKLSRG